MNNPPDNLPEPTLPPGLQRDLSALYRPANSVPPDLDAEVLAAARERLDRAHRPAVLFTMRRVAAGLAAAAAVAIVAVVVWPTRAPQNGPTSGTAVALRKSEVEGPKEAGRTGGQGVRGDAPALASAARAQLPGDINGDGRVDILDALAVARAIDGGSVPAEVIGRADMTGDGALDQRDIDAIAMLAVSVASLDGHQGGEPVQKLKGGGS